LFVSACWIPAFAGMTEWVASAVDLSGEQA
jgi:hypothetical protein